MLKLIALILTMTPLIASASSQAENIRRAVRSHLREIRDCYRTTLNKATSGEKIEGKVVAGWDIQSDGSVSKTWIVEKSTTLKNEEIQNCMTEKIKAWKFPAPPNGTTVRIEGFPFTMNSGEVEVRTGK